MDNTIQFPDGYRYNSDMELFKAAVDCTKEMLHRFERGIEPKLLDSGKGLTWQK